MPDSTILPSLLHQGGTDGLRIPYKMAKRQMGRKRKDAAVLLRSRRVPAGVQHEWNVVSAPGCGTGLPEVLAAARVLRGVHVPARANDSDGRQLLQLSGLLAFHHVVSSRFGEVLYVRGTQ